MKASLTISSVLLAVSVAASGGSNETAPKPALRLVLSEVQPGVLSSRQDCLLVFDDHNFHAERAFINNGRDRERKVSQGRISDADWASLITIVDGKPFRDLRVPAARPSPVTEGLHPYAISVARPKGFQNMEFLTNKSLKPYEPQVRPLLEWWKSVRNQRTPESDASADSRCALTNAGPILSQ